MSLLSAQELLREFAETGARVQNDRMSPDGWLTVTEAAARKGLEPQQIRDLIKAGRLAAEKSGPIWLIKVEDIDKLVFHGPGRPKKKRGRPRKIE